MAGNDSGTETEVKIRLRSPDAFLPRLEAAGFSITKPRVFEANTVFDEPGRDLRARACLLRLREVPREAIVTFKGPAERGKHKSREELETTIGDAGVAALIFQRLGFAPTFRYEKYRTEYGRSGQQGVVTVDETPVGWFIELEGSPDWIDKTAGEIGFSEADYLTESYGALYLQHCLYTGVQPTNMVFEERPKPAA